ncbi:hypothetical protein GCM10007863_20510 [Dyella mobilis]|nr:hypothetical protein GCM10007863_20510 [Dyella mobilis]
MGNITDFICEAIEGVGNTVAKAIEVGGDVIIDGVDYVRENPGKTATIAAVTLVSGGACWAVAGPIAAAAGGAGLLGSASTGTAIATLSGAALESASLAALGGGALAAGGAGMAGGTVVVAGTGAALGGTGAVAVTKRIGKNRA